MKKALFLFCCIGLLLYTWNRYNTTTKKQQLPFESSTRSSKEIVTPKERNLKPQKKINLRFSKLESSKFENTNQDQLRKTTARKPRSNSYPVNFDSKKMANFDNEGSLYPTNLTATKKFIVAYGDLILAEIEDLEAIRSGEKPVKIPKPQLWPKGVVPIEIASDLKNTKQETLIKEVIQYFKNNSDIKIRVANLKTDQARVKISAGSDNCYAQVGYTGGITNMSLHEDCSTSAIFHEFFHILGFFHEQNRFDRDEHVQVLWENIEEKYWPQFKLFPAESFPPQFTQGGVFNFTFESIMIYNSSSFSANSDFSMVKTDGTPFKSNWSTPSPSDIQRLKSLYKNEVQ